MPRPPAPQVKPVSTKGPSGVLIGTVVLLVVALIAGLVWAVTRDAGSDLDAVGTSSTLPEGGGISVGPGVEADVPQLHVYGDFQCPWCGVLEDAIGEDTFDMVAAGEVNLTVTLMSFLDGRVRGEGSLRTANAALCADDANRFLPYYQAAYANRPSGGGASSDEQLVSLAREVGIEGEALDTFRSCVDDRTHEDYVNAMQERANRDGVSGTPRLYIDGTEVPSEELTGLMEGTLTLEEVVAAHS